VLFRSKYDDAIKMMTGRKFAVAEGANLNVAEHWANAHILRAQQNLAASRFKEALIDLQSAVTLPAKLPSSGLGGAGGRSAEVSYWTGLAYEGTGEREKAADSWNRAITSAAAGPGRRGGAAPASSPGGSQTYYQALCLQKLGQADQAKALFQSLVDSGQRALQQQPAAAGGRAAAGRQQSPRVRLANAHYLTGLGYLGLNDLAKAKAELIEAVQAYPDLVGARAALASLPKR
jgi:tetratricopeptide (TPR) repeat protein